MKRLALILAAVLLFACCAPAALAADEPAVYPSGSTSKYIPYTTSMPEIIWTTTGEENGLIGSVYKFEGTVIDRQTIPTDTGSVEQITVETADGTVTIADMYNSMCTAMTEGGLDLFFSQFIEEPDANYTLPEVGDSGLFYGVYTGFSQTLETPVLYLGVNEYLVDQTRDPDSVPEPSDTSDPTEDTIPAEDHEPTLGEKNALGSAETFLKYSAFSYTGLIDMLEFEGYSHEEAAYAADHCGADWFAEAAESAETFLKYSSFSRSGLIEMLEFEGYTHDQAVYAVEQVGY